MKTIIYAGITLLSLSFSGIADDELNDGPGLFSGKKGEFVLFKTGKLGTEKDLDKEVKESNSSDSQSMSQKQEFMLFKNWKQHKDNNTEAYQEFLLWIEYKKMSQ